jgi:hypothetical protein
MATIPPAEVANKHGEQKLKHAKNQMASYIKANHRPRLTCFIIFGNKLFDFSPTSLVSRRFWSPSQRLQA